MLNGSNVINANPNKNPPNAVKNPDAYNKISDALGEISVPKYLRLIPWIIVGINEKTAITMNIYALVVDIFGIP